MTTSATTPQAAVRSQPDVANLVATEQLRLILAHTEVGTAVATAFGLLLAYQVYNGAIHSSVARSTVLIWVAIKIAVALPRMLHAYVCRRRGKVHTDAWMRWTVPLLAVDGAVWGLGGAWMMNGPNETWTVVGACLACVACVATFGLQVRASATAAYVAPIILPMAIALLLRQDEAGLLTGIGLVMFLGLLLSTARRSERRMAEVFTLRLVAEDALALANKHSQAKDRFLAVVSHELRTPLHGILGLTRLTRSEVPKSDGALHYRLELIEEAGDHLKRMVEDLLDVSAIEAGRLELKHAPLDLVRELALLREVYEARAAENGIRFVMHTSPSLGVWVVGDAVRVAQVLHNLLGNAFKFTPMGGTIEMSVDREDGSDHVTVEIQDTGPGVPIDEAERIFEVFTQGSSYLGSRPEGFGLGLAISRQLARAMGGDVSCQPHPGPGACFQFSVLLPLADASAAFTESAAPGKRLAQRRAGSTVFVADDDELSSLVNASVVRRMGCQVEEFPDGKQLLERVLRTSGRPAAIIMDWDMPQVNGERATRAIREHERAHGLPRLPIIGLSANASHDYAAGAAHAGMDRFLSKPCDPAVLSAVLEAVVAAPPRAAAASAIAPRRG